MRVLVTGANGFIGSAVARCLSNSGHDVFGVVRPQSTADRLAATLPADNIVRLDLDQNRAFDTLIAAIRPDCCVHLAWYVVHGRYQHAEENLHYLRQGIDLFSRLIAAGCPRIVGIGTCFEYDTSAECLDERSPTRPANLYARCKLELGHALEHLASRAGTEWAWIRLFYLYGPGEHPQRLIPRVISAVERGVPIELHGPEHIRDYLHVDDMAAAIGAVAACDLSGFVNVGSGVPVSVRRVVEVIAQASGRPAVIRQTGPPSVADPPFLCANVDLLKRATGWVPSMTLEEGLRQTVCHESLR
jgi:nucleoside-diphosphate-sugar epimerase